MFKKLLIGFLGINFTAIGLNLLIATNVGMGPFDSMTIAVQSIFNIDKFGNASFLIHLTFALIMLVFYKKLKVDVKVICLSVLTIFILTRVVNGYALVFNQFNISYSVINFMIAFLILNFGLYLMAITNLLIAPYDKFVVEIANLWDKNLGYVRVLSDVSLITIVILSIIILGVSVPITISTIIITVGTGYNISIYMKLFDNYKLLQV